METSTTSEDALNHVDETREPSRAVVEVVADAEGVDPLELPPLYEAIDPDALDALFRPSACRTDVPPTSGEVRFGYHGHEVHITAAGRVSLEDD